ncbi:cache domain-containing protein [Pseudomonas shirazensis]|uniref:cache domain-containing protein n=1 Tax=Pseudomonas shirazensis TaxID=2745494 RepID=UPI003987517C
MKHVLSLVLLSLVSMSPMASTEGVPSGYEQDAEVARTLLGKAIKRYKEVGDKALAEFSRQGQFTQDSFYIYVVDIRGKMLASGGPSALLVGRDISPLLDDSLRQAFIEVLNAPIRDEVQSREYRWTNWHDNKVERKRAFYQRVDDKIFASGYYLPRSSEAEAQRLLDEAIVEIQDHDVVALQRINRLDPYFNRDDLYVYVVDLRTERFVAHGFQARLLNTDFRSLTTNSGEAVGEKVLNALQGKQQAQASYGWVNPVTGKPERKQVLIQRSGDYLVAVGFYIK